jgi:SAM-dependent methyltransferase
LKSVNPFDPAPEDGGDLQCLAFQHGMISCDGASFDAVICCMALHPLGPTDKLALLKEIRRVLRSGGKLYLADYDMAFSKGQTLVLIGTGDLYGPDTVLSHADGTWKAQIELGGFSHFRQVYSDADASGRVTILEARR